MVLYRIQLVQPYALSSMGWIDLIFKLIDRLISLVIDKLFQLGSGAIVVQLGQPYALDSMRLLLWDCDDRSYSYYIEVNWEIKYYRDCKRNFSLQTPCKDGIPDLLRYSLNLRLVKKMLNTMFVFFRFKSAYFE